MQNSAYIRHRAHPREDIFGSWVQPGRLHTSHILCSQYQFPCIEQQATLNGGRSLSVPCAVCLVSRHSAQHSIVVPAFSICLFRSVSAFSVALLTFGTPHGRRTIVGGSPSPPLAIRIAHWRLLWSLALDTARAGGSPSQRVDAQR